MMSFILLLRPHSWIKNFFIFIPLFFSKDIFNPEKILPVSFSFVIFSLVASVVYIVNDIFDKESDSLHPSKKNRPIASGKISITKACFLVVLLLTLALALTSILVPNILIYILIYLFINLGYSSYFKRIAPFDIILIASFYLLRVLVGGRASGTEISEWLLLCTVFISLFLVTGKRIAEFNLKTKRQVTENYNSQFLFGILLISATLLVISYSLYTVLVLHSNMAVYSIFLVLLGVIRYIYIVSTTNKGEYPEHAIFSDKIIFLSSVCWIIFMYSIFYLS